MSFLRRVLWCMRLVFKEIKSTYARLAGRRKIVNNSQKPQQASQKYNGPKESTHCYCWEEDRGAEIFDPKYFQICAEGGGGRGPEGWPPSLLRIGTASQQCSWPGCTLEKGKRQNLQKRKVEHKTPANSVLYHIEPHLVNFKVKQVTGYDCSASQRLLTFANM